MGKVIVIPIEPEFSSGEEKSLQRVRERKRERDISPPKCNSSERDSI